MVERDWVSIVAVGTCDECGLKASAVARHDLAEQLRFEAGEWTSLLLERPRERLTLRSFAGWSALEYAAHVRDVLHHFAQRVERAATEDRPVFGWWDHEAAAVDQRYNEQEPARVAAELRAQADRLASLAGSLTEPDWQREGSRRPHEVFSIEGLMRFALHETRHHRYDAEERSRAAECSG